MTEEQIKQNAEDYINENTQGVVIDANTRNFLLDVYLAGAHSRDEEITRLSAEIKDDNYVISKLQDELNQLRNPWISVKDHLPDYPESEYDIDNMYLVCREGSSLAFPAIFRRDGKWYIFDNTQIREIIAPDYWMHMPVKKGE